MAPGRRDRGVVYVKVFDWLSWFPCMWTACDHHSLLLQWRHMTVWPLMWLVQLWHITIWPLMWLVQLWKVPRKTPLLAYINQEFVAIKQNCLDGTPVVCYCLWLAEGVGLADSRLTSPRDPSALLREVPLPFSFCGAPPRFFHLGSFSVFNQFSSVAKSCPSLCNPMDCSTPGFPVLYQLPELAHTHVHGCHPTILPSVVPFSSCLQSCPAAGSFQMSQFFTSDGQSIGVSALPSVLPMNVQDWFP